MPKKKVCKRTQKTTNFAWSLVITVAKTIMEYCGAAVKGVKDASMFAFAYAAVAVGFIAPAIWSGVKELSKTGFTALHDLILSLYKSAHAKKIDTTDTKQLLRDIKRRLLTKNPKLKDDPIMYDINELNKLCYYIDNMNEDGMSKLEFEDAQWKLSNDIKVLLIEFGRVMNRA